MQDIKNIFFAIIVMSGLSLASSYGMLQSAQHTLFQLAKPQQPVVDVGAIMDQEALELESQAKKKAEQLACKQLKSARRILLRLPKPLQIYSMQFLLRPIMLDTKIFTPFQRINNTSSLVSPVSQLPAINVELHHLDSREGNTALLIPTLNIPTIHIVDNNGIRSKFAYWKLTTTNHTAVSSIHGDNSPEIPRRPKATEATASIVLKDGTHIHAKLIEEHGTKIRVDIGAECMQLQHHLDITSTDIVRAQTRGILSTPKDVDTDKKEDQ